jgi:arginyl-tRNA synthetase
LASALSSFYILKVDPKKKMLFNPEESIDLQGFTGPFVQYTHARISSLLRKAVEGGISFEQSVGVKELDAVERELIMQLYHFPSVILESASKYEPSTLANYLYHLAKDYNHFYQKLPVLNAENECSEVLPVTYFFVCRRCDTERHGFAGITVPERM